MAGQNSNGINRDQLVTLSDLENFREKLVSELRSLLCTNSEKQTSRQWLRSAEVRKMLGVSGGTLQNFRVNGTLSYSKIGGIVFYKHDEIIKLLERNSTKSGSRG